MMDWDERYQNQDTPWDHGEAAPAIREVVKRECFSPDAKVLVPGCGLGHDVRAWVDAGFHATGLDVSAVALNRAEKRYGRKGLQWLQVDMFDPEGVEHAGYDIVWEHTCFCAIPLDMRMSYVDVVHRSLKPGGIFCGLFFTDTGNPAGVGPPFNVKPEEVERLFSSRFTLLWQKAPEQAYESRVGREWLMVWKKS